jgi:hypothetical protein
MRNKRRTEEGFVHVMRGEQLTGQRAVGGWKNGSDCNCSANIRRDCLARYRTVFPYYPEVERERSRR